jgi:hypothetical protein
LRAGVFSCRLGVLYEGLGVKKIATFEEKIILKMLGIKTLDPDPELDSVLPT